MGQNVVYADGHVEFQPTPFCGSAVRDDQGNLTKIRDNIYAPEPTAAPPGAKPGDKPAAAATTVMGAPQTAFDAVLLPPADFKPAADPTTAPAKAPGR
jgi:prepilin-type processing-associated H-X9-DG protein